MNKVRTGVSEISGAKGPSGFHHWSAKAENLATSALVLLAAEVEADRPDVVLMQRKSMYGSILLMTPELMGQQKSPPV